MSKPYQTGVRLTDEQRAALEQIAKVTKQDLAELIRHAVDALIQHYERCGKRLVLPVDFSETVQVLSSSAEEHPLPAGKISRAA